MEINYADIEVCTDCHYANHGLESSNSALSRIPLFDMVTDNSVCEECREAQIAIDCDHGTRYDVDGEVCDGCGSSEAGDRFKYVHTFTAKK